MTLKTCFIQKIRDTRDFFLSSTVKTLEQVRTPAKDKQRPPPNTLAQGKRTDTKVGKNNTRLPGAGGKLATSTGRILNVKKQLRQKTKTKQTSHLVSIYTFEEPTCTLSSWVVEEEHNSSQVILSQTYLLTDISEKQPMNEMPP